jgi:hypothetical protein
LLALHLNTPHRLSPAEAVGILWILVARCVLDIVWVGPHEACVVGIREGLRDAGRGKEGCSHVLHQHHDYRWWRGDDHCGAKQDAAAIHAANVLPQLG